MDTKPLERFATWARRELIAVVDAQASAVLASGSIARSERSETVRRLESEIERHGRQYVIDKVAYTWFNRIIALRFMDVRGYTDAGVVSPAQGQGQGQGQGHGQPEILADAKRGNLDPEVIASNRTADAVLGLLDGTRHSTDAEGEAYALLLTEYCRYWHKSMPFMFEREGDYTELLVPANLLADGAILSRAREALTEAVCEDVEVIGWLYQFYISERKAEVFAGFSAKGSALKLAGAEEIPAATQLFTPHWLVRYLVENSLGRQWMLNNPKSRLASRMDYYIAPNEEETDFVAVTSPEQLTVIDPACGSGHMLTYAFDLLYLIYEEEGYAPSEIPSLILTHNLYGTEIDPRAGALAAFALTMKARAQQRTFFSKQVEPRICVIEAITFDQEELDFLITKDGDQSAEESFWNEFSQGDLVGALIRPNGQLIDRLRLHLERLSVSVDILSTDTMMRARRVIYQASNLTRAHVVVVANPPYLGSRRMEAGLVEWGERYFPRTRYDLYSMFFERSLETLVPGGTVGLLAMQSWMFLSRLGDFRRGLLEKFTIANLVHLGSGAFESFGGEVVQVAAVCVTKAPPSHVGNYFRLVDFDSAQAKETAFLAARSGTTSEYVFNMSQSKFLRIPGAPVAYWASERSEGAFLSGRRVEDIAPVRQGFQTGDNDRFLRSWWEVPSSSVNARASSIEQFHTAGARYVPYLKGGGFRKWYGNDEHVVAFDPSSFELLKNQGNKLPSRSLYFADSVTWSDISTGSLGARYAGPGNTFSSTGPSAFPTNTLARDLVLAVLNSAVVGELLEFMGAGLHFNVGSIRELPVPSEVPLGEQEILSSTVDELISLHRDDWISHEMAREFSCNSLVCLRSHTPLKQILEKHLEELEKRTNRVVALQKQSDDIVGRLYGLPAEAGSAISLRYQVGLDGAEKHVIGQLITELVSYAVGCIFGRYSLDKPGLVLAGREVTLQDYVATVRTSTFSPDADNVIPFVDDGWFEDDIVERFRQFLRAALGSEHFEENLRFVEESLGVKSIRDYFITKNGKSKFYDDHVQRYKKRPIYWMFSSPKGSFNALIYVHRYTPSTVSTVLNEYLREYRAKLDVALADAENAAARGSVKEQKEADRLRKVLVELAEYEHDVLYPLATRQLPIDLDDGVLVNYLRFGRALKDIGLEKDRRKVEGWTWPRYPLEAAQ